VARFKAEASWAWRVAVRYARRLPSRRRTEAPGRELAVADASGEAPIVLIQADPEAYLLPGPALRLVRTLASRPEISVALPVSNEAGSEEERSAPPFAYQTPTLLEEVGDLYAASSTALRPASPESSPVFAVRRSVLEPLPPGLPLSRVPGEAARRGLRAAVDPGAYVHRYGRMDASAREDLAAKVPAGAAGILDVGCSSGATAAALRARGPRVEIFGIEPDAEDAARAARVYDRVIAARLEDVREDFTGRFDAILFGDVLEHLADPSDALVQVGPWLSKRGVVIASVPNVGHWSIVDDLIRGRFDYVPYSILSGTHVRYFTRSTLRDLFEASGYRLVEVDTQILPAPPAGAARRDRLAQYPGASPDLDVSEFVAVASRLSSPQR
jgi:2-polyprenyl-3-methyl-5-hydroxy-6-metoxy-1,4-benzoquinol methylase